MKKDFDRGEPSPGDLLQQELRQFASTRPLQDREKLLHHLIANLKSVTRDDVAGLAVAHGDFQERFRVAAQSAIATPFEGRASGPQPREVLPWRGTYNATALNSRGDVIGSVSHANSINRDGLPDLKKAIFRLNLGLEEGVDEGLDNDDNFAHYEMLGFEAGVELFIGEAAGLDVSRPGSKGEGTVYVGVSECRFNKDYLFDLLPKAAKFSQIDPLPFTANHYVGRLEQQLAELIVHYVMIEVPPRPVKEPAFFAQARRSH